MTRYDNMQKQYAHKKKGEKDTNKNKCNQKKKNDDKNDERFTMCQKHTSYTLLTLLFYVKKKLRKLQEMVEKDLLYYYVLNVSKLLCSKILECLSTPSSILPERRPAKLTKGG